MKIHKMTAVCSKQVAIYQKLKHKYRNGCTSNAKTLTADVSQVNGTEFC